MFARSGALLLLVALVLAACGGGGETSAPATTAEAGGVEQLDNVLQLRADFEADRGKTRLLVLFSPT